MSELRCEVERRPQSGARYGLSAFPSAPATSSWLVALGLVCLLASSVAIMKCVDVTTRVTTDHAADIECAIASLISETVVDRAPASTTVATTSGAGAVPIVTLRSGAADSDPPITIGTAPRGANGACTEGQLYVGPLSMFVDEPSHVVLQSERVYVCASNEWRVLSTTGSGSAAAPP